ncbi:MAG: trimethylamine methyltransferase family protein, partial [Ignavibacteria bacterium]|nr:trimethylamine methyltransferase family protein [Ignavibacteria bacterium]
MPGNNTKPLLKLLSNELIDDIISEAIEVLQKVGVYVENEEAVKLLTENGAVYDKSNSRIIIPQKLVESSLSSAPSSIRIYDLEGKNSYLIGDDEVHFDPGSAALWIFDCIANEKRKAYTNDLIKFHSLVQKLDNLHFQSTGLISSDVPEKIADCYRLFIALQYCSKPIITGTFEIESFKPMYEMLSAVRGSSENLRLKPLAIFDACPSPPLKWSNLTAQSVIDCAKAGIPSEFVAMPLTGATAPATLTGALVQLTAENLSGVVIAQLAKAGAPVIFGGSPAAFDMRTANAPMGAIETMMIDSAYAQIGKKLKLPTHAYMGLSDSKCVDSQAGLESGIGAIIGALSGINVISGPGMLDYESTQSLEKLVIDNEICGMAYRLLEGIKQREKPMAIHLFTDSEFLNDILT